MMGLFLRMGKGFQKWMMLRFGKKGRGDWMAKKTEVVSKEEIEPKFCKSDLLRSQLYFDRQDMIGALLEDDVFYTCEEVDGLIEKYLKGEVD